MSKALKEYIRIQTSASNSTSDVSRGTTAHCVAVRCPACDRPS